MPDPLSHLRGTGRTTRMLRHAHQLAAEDGRAVYVIGATKEHAAQLQHAYDQLFHPEDDPAFRHGISFEDAQKLGGFSWETLSVRGAHPNCVFLVDHYAIEARYSRILQMLHAYDPAEASSQPESTALLEQLIAKWRERSDTLNASGERLHLAEMAVNATVNFTGAARFKECADELSALLPALAHSEARRLEVERALMKDIELWIERAGAEDARATDAEARAESLEAQLKEARAEGVKAGYAEDTNLAEVISSLRTNLQSVERETDNR